VCFPVFLIAPYADGRPPFGHLSLPDDTYEAFVGIEKTNWQTSSKAKTEELLNRRQQSKQKKGWVE
jgi:hypothetical protein